jgi:hypothetical protein
VREASLAYFHDTQAIQAAKASGVHKKSLLIDYYFFSFVLYLFYLSLTSEPLTDLNFPVWPEDATVGWKERVQDLPCLSSQSRIMTRLKRNISGFQDKRRQKRQLALKRI